MAVFKIGRTNLCQLTGSIVKRWKASVAAVNKVEDIVDPAEWSQAKPYEQLPGPNVWPVLGTLWQFLPIIGENLDVNQQVKIAQWRYEKYGPISRDIVPGFPPVVTITRPEDVEVVFRNEGRFPIRLGFETLKLYRKKKADQFSTAGLLVSQGDDWWQMRTKAQQPMLKTKNIKNYLPVIGQIADEFIDRMRLIRLENGEMRPDFINEMYRWALESVAVVALNTRLGCLSPNLSPDSEALKMINAVNTTFQEVFKLEFSIPYWRLITTPALRRLFKAQDFFVETSMKYVQRTMEEIKNRPPDSEEEQTILEEFFLRGMSPQHAVIMVIDMLMAGIDTTSHAMSFLWYFLARNPEKQEILRREILSTVGGRGSPITMAALNELHYLKACLKESLRLMPLTVGNARVIEKNLVLNGYQIPKGVLVSVPHQWMCLQEEFFPNAKEYLPERWIKGHELESKASPYVMLPFGFGVRMCIGRRLAELEMWQLTVKLLQNFRVEYHHEDIGCRFGIVNAPDKPLRFKLIDL